LGTLEDAGRHLIPSRDTAVEPGYVDQPFSRVKRAVSDCRATRLTPRLAVFLKGRLDGGKAMFQLCGVFAELERSIIQERVRAGLERARAKGKTLGRPKTDPKVEAKIRKLAGQGMGKGKDRPYTRYRRERRAACPGGVANRNHNPAQRVFFISQRVITCGS